MAGIKLLSSAERQVCTAAVLAKLADFVLVASRILIAYSLMNIIVGLQWKPSMASGRPVQSEIKVKSNDEHAALEKKMA